MLDGVGIDLVSIERISKILHRWDRRFLSRVFTENEIEYCQKAGRASCLAARFAAKEALAKALGHGLCRHFRWTDVEVIRDKAGKPSFRISGITQALVENKSVFLSLTHTDCHAAAIVTVELK